MRHSGWTKSVAILTALAVLIVIWQPGAWAATPPVTSASKGGVTISPALQNIVVSPADADGRFEFSVTNNTDAQQDFSLSVVDFGSLDETGGLLFVGEGQKVLENYRYGLSSWAKPAVEQVTIKPKSSVMIPIVITNDASLAPGGHYGAVMVSPVAAAGKAEAEVEVNHIATSLLFVKKTGGETYKLGLESFETDTNLLALPDSVRLRFHNTGNVRVVPRGFITITDPHGRTVRQGAINVESGLVLPDTYRKIETALQTTDRAWLPGTYRLTVSYRLDDQTTFQTETAAIFYVNGIFVLAAAGLLVSLVIAIGNRRVRKALSYHSKRLFRSFSKLIHR